ncbi:ATP synthase F0 subunit B [Phytomonospora sp. NPDC050363]|uniref:ATP synthase F0 subunit B n=1 Tax=Phytomonospora sp. NPDC050363 TaxID=3155642 RepID=UPI0033CE7B4E
MIYDDEGAWDPRPDAELDGAAEAFRTRLDAADAAAEDITPDEVQERLRRFLDARRAETGGGEGPSDPFGDWTALGDRVPVRPGAWTVADGPFEAGAGAHAHIARIQAEAEALRMEAGRLRDQSAWHCLRSERLLNGALEQASARVEAARREAASILEEARRHAAQIREEARAEVRRDQTLTVITPRGRMQVVVLDTRFTADHPAEEPSRDRGERATVAADLLESWLAVLGGEERRRVRARAPRTPDSAGETPKWELTFPDLESRVRVRLEELAELESEAAGGAEGERVPIYLRAPVEWATGENGDGSLVPAEGWDEIVESGDRVAC